jgi:hypothetical protein
VPNSHIEDEQLDLYALGRVPEGLLPEIEEHLLECEICQGRLARSDEFAVLFQAAATQGLRTRGVRQWLLWAQRAAVPLAAAAAIAVVIFVSGQGGRRPAPPVVVEMRSMRGPEAFARVEAGRPSTLLLDVAAPEGVATYTALVLDLSGAEVSRPPIESREGRIALQIAPLRKGLYWVRVARNHGNDPVSEYGLEAR